MDSWSLGPPLLVGERIVFRSNGSYLPGTIKWLGMLKNYFGNQLVAGLALDDPFPQGGGDGSFGKRRMFQCPMNHGIFTPFENVLKLDDFMFVNPGYPLGGRSTNEVGSRRSVQNGRTSLPRPQQPLPQLQPEHEVHYQNHFFSTIHDSSPELNLATGYDPFSSFKTDTDSEEQHENFFDNQPPARDNTWTFSIRRKGNTDDQSSKTKHQIQNDTAEIRTVADAKQVMKQLEEAIALGNHRLAAQLAKEMSKLHITAKLTTQEMSQNLQKQSNANDKTIKKNVEDETISLQMYVEDEESYRGPYNVAVQPAMTLTELKQHVQCHFKIPCQVQRWILDKTLATDDNQPLFTYGIKQKGQNIYLYIVPKELNKPTTSEVEKSELPEAKQETEKPKPPPEETRKGRYWNYEHDRWSFCSDEESDEEEPRDEIPKTSTAEGPENVVKKDDQNVEDDNDEWEYYYEDAELPKEQNPPAEGLKKNGWICPNCTLLNSHQRPGCEACATDKPPNIAGAEGEEKVQTDANKDLQAKNLDNYKKLDDLDLIPNIEHFECVICYLDIEPGDGVVLRECLHMFCKECLAGAIEHSESPQVGCPYKDNNYSCDMTILEREMKALVSPAILEKLQQKSLKEAEANLKNTFHCKTPDCNGWCFVNDTINSYKCPVCKRLNCITCQAIHEGLDCKQYQQSMLNEAQDENSKKTKEWIEGLISTGEALQCPSCQVILLKKWGCDWVRCTYCRTEICWVTRQLRWGPNGKGDTSAGCRCMADGRTKCHPLCNYCH